MFPLPAREYCLFVGASVTFHCSIKLCGILLYIVASSSGEEYIPRCWLCLWCWCWFQDIGIVFNLSPFELLRIWDPEESSWWDWAGVGGVWGEVFWRKCLRILRHPGAERDGKLEYVPEWLCVEWGLCRWRSRRGLRVVGWEPACLGATGIWGVERRQLP